jgi:two-component system, OmpR family, response regulator TctD
MRILLVEDNRPLCDWLTRTLRHEKYSVDCAYSGDDADLILLTEEYGLVILDLSLPKLSGLEVLRRLRARGNAVPVLILTANDSIDGRVSGLNAGADDYLAKPFNIEELEARIRALLRRGTLQKSPVLRCGSLTFDSNTRQFSLSDELLVLTAREHAVLEALVRRAGGTISKSTLMTSVFGLDDDANPSAIEIYVHRVRRKLAGTDVEIATLRGLGYVLRASDGA